jgi:hypothetical protein
VPTSVLPFGDGRFGIAKTLYEAYNDKVPNLENLKVFGCAIYPILQKGKHPRHFEPRHRPGFIFVGMLGSTIWKVISLATVVGQPQALRPFLNAPPGGKFP